MPCNSVRRQEFSPFWLAGAEFHFGFCIFLEGREAQFEIV